MWFLLIFKGCLIAIIKENSNPAKAQYINAEEIFESTITFLINIASVPENINASILYKHAFENVQHPRQSECTPEKTQTPILKSSLKVEICM